MRSITYTFEFADRPAWRFQMSFDKNGHFVRNPTEGIPGWTRLEFHKCEHCPIKKTMQQQGTEAQCPVAANLDQVVENSKNAVSFGRTKVTVTTPEREYFKECATQEGLRSIFGLIMATSGCPHLEWLRPLARFHLPFADIEETLFRVLSLQLVESFVKSDFPALTNSSKLIEKRYADVMQVNHKFIERIRSYCQADADKNAIAALDAFVQMFPYQREAGFGSLRKLFEAESPS